MTSSWSIIATECRKSAVVTLYEPARFVVGCQRIVSFDAQLADPAASRGTRTGRRAAAAAGRSPRRCSATRDVIVDLSRADVRRPVADDRPRVPRAAPARARA